MKYSTGAQIYFHDRKTRFSGGAFCDEQNLAVFATTYNFQNPIDFLDCLVKILKILETTTFPPEQEADVANILKFFNRVLTDSSCSREDLSFMQTSEGYPIYGCPVRGHLKTAASFENSKTVFIEQVYHVHNMVETLGSMLDYYFMLRDNLKKIALVDNMNLRKCATCEQLFFAHSGQTRYCCHNCFAQKKKKNAAMYRANLQESDIVFERLNARLRVFCKRTHSKKNPTAFHSDLWTAWRRNVALKQDSPDFLNWLLACESLLQQDHTNNQHYHSLYEFLCPYNTSLDNGDLYV